MMPSRWLGMILWALPAVCAAAPHTLAKGGGACTGNEDCQWSGVCNAGACVCDAAWTGAHCEVLHVLPTPPGARSNRAYPADPTASSWGGTVVPHEGKYHLYVSEMGYHCGLAAWTHNSFVRHAVSDTVEGPYTPQEVVLPIYGHNAHALLAEDGSMVVFHVGGGSPHPGYTHYNCTNGTTPLADGAAPVLPMGKLSPWTVQVSATPDGPWATRGLLCDGPCRTLNNPSPTRLNNGTYLLAWHMNGGRDAGKWLLCLAASDSVFGPYRILPDGNWSHPTVEITTPHPPGTKAIFCEDPFLWQDTRDTLHLLVHCYGSQGDFGSHLFSRDGVTWHQSSAPAFSATVAHTDGSETTYYHRQRPKLLVQDGVPTHFLTGLALMNKNDPPAWQQWCKGTGMLTPNCDAVETHIQAINTQPGQGAL